jgi:hypothetical protein
MSGVFRQSFDDTNNAQETEILGGTDQTKIGNSADSLKTAVTNGSGAAAVNVQDGGNSLTIDATSLPLPTGASTSSLQTTANTSLASLDTKTPALGQALAAASTPVVLTAAQLTTLTPLTTVTVTQATGTNLHTVVDSSALPTGAATAANQATIISSLASIDAGIPATLGQTTMSASMPVTIASNQPAIPLRPYFIKYTYDDMNAANGGVARDTAVGTTYVTIYNYSGSGYLFGFSVTLEGNLVGADPFSIQLTLDSVITFTLSTLDIGTAALYNFLTDGDSNLLGVQVNSNTFVFKAPAAGPLQYSSSVKVEIKKLTSGTKRFRAGLISLAKET